ncbi:MAG: nucleoside-diphosphate sugar epimerase/dehydratase [Clostridium sp.]|uniref:polysaccharide biosynthesis protein n=1 Tax=Clostridium sp. TaxID=1506 RepID=UPI003027ADF9
MKKENKIIVVDIILIVVSLYLALLLKFDFKIKPEYINLFKISIIPVVIFTIVFNIIFKLYSNIWKYASVGELLSIVYSMAASNIVFVVYGYFINRMLFKTQFFRFPITVHIIFWLLGVLSLGGIRFIYRILENNCAGKLEMIKTKNLLIIGAGDAGAILIKEIKNNTSLNYKIVGLVDDNTNKIGKRINGVKVLGDRNKIISICKLNKVDEIMLAMPSVDKHTKKDILNICKQVTNNIKTMPGIYKIIDDNVNVKHMRDVNIDDLLGRDSIKLKSEDIDKYIKGKTILVTGGGGSIGSEIIRQIAKFDPKKILILDIYENNAYDLEMEFNRNCPEINKRVLIASVRDLVRLEQIFNEHKPEVVFHAAAHKHVPLMEDNVGDAVKNNILGTYNVAKCCDKYNVDKFVLISTDKAVNPTNVMGATKRFCELIIQAFNEKSSTDYVAVRFGNVLGSNGSVIPLFKKQIEKGGPVTITHPEITRFFMTIPEAAQLVIQAGGLADGGEIFVLDMGKPVKMVDLARDLITLSGFKPDVDIKIEYVGLRPGEKLYEELLMDEIALTSTEHSKIFVEKPKDATMEFIEESIARFRNVDNMNKEEIIKLIQEKVPTYVRKS